MAKELNQFLFEHFQKEYQYQLERTEKLRDRISFAVGFLTALGGVLAYYITEFPHSWHCGRTLLFYLPLIGAVGLASFSIGIVLWVIGTSFKYATIPDNIQLQKFVDNYLKWNYEVGGNEADILPTFKGFLQTAYRDASHHNFNVNRKRIDRLLLANRLAVLAFLCAALMLPSFLLEKGLKEKEPSLIRLVKPNKQDSKPK